MFVLPAEGGLGSGAGTGPLRRRTTCPAPGGVPVRVRAPVPAGLAARGRIPLQDLADHRPALGVVLPGLTSTVGRHVEQTEGSVGHLVTPAGRRIGEEHPVTVAQEAGEVA